MFFCLVTQLEYVLLLWLPWFKKYCKNKTRNSLEVQTQTKWLVFSTIQGARISYIVLYQMGKPFWSTWTSRSHQWLLESSPTTSYNQHITCVVVSHRYPLGHETRVFVGTPGDWRSFSCRWSWTKPSFATGVPESGVPTPNMSYISNPSNVTGSDGSAATLTILDTQREFRLKEVNVNN